MRTQSRRVRFLYPNFDVRYVPRQECCSKLRRFATKAGALPRGLLVSHTGSELNGNDGLGRPSALQATMFLPNIVMDRPQTQWGFRQASERTLRCQTSSCAVGDDVAKAHSL